MSALTQKFGKTARNYATGAFLSVSTALTSVAVTVPALGFLGNIFTATQAEAKDTYGTFAQVVVDPEHKDIVRWLSTDGNPSIVHNSVFSMSGKWTNSNIRNAIKDTPLDAIPGYKGKTLGDYLQGTPAVKRNYPGICVENGTRKTQGSGEYIPKPGHSQLVNFSFLAGQRGQTLSKFSSNYTVNKGSELGDGNCSPNLPRGFQP